MEKQISRKEIYSGKVIHVVLDDIKTADNKDAKREVVIHNGGACIAIKDKDSKYFMVKQYRYPLETDMLEFCAGKIEKGEDPDNTVLREAEEEVGCTIKNLHKFGYIVPTCGYSSEKIYLYYGEVDTYVNQHFDEDEMINTYKFTFEEIEEMIINGTINDAKTIGIVYHMNKLGLK